MEELIEGVNAKVCGCCKELKLFSEFSKNNRNKQHGLQYKCKDCFKKYKETNKGLLSAKASEKYFANREEILLSQKEYNKTNAKSRAEYSKRYWVENKEFLTKRHTEYNETNKATLCTARKKYRKENAGAINEKVAERDAAKIQRTPAWLTKEDKKQLQDFYYLAKALTEATGVKHVVDHIIPLRGKNVSGLHVPSNLQILTESENASKQNKFDIEEFNGTNYSTNGES